MEISFNDLKQKDVVSVVEGKHLGKVCDVIFQLPENVICGFYVTGCKGFKFNKQDIFIPICNIVKIGEDVILTNLPDAEQAQCCPPPKQKRNCRQAPPCPPPQPQNPPYDARRSFDEYE
jgi:sporulation protein YlmC with PRC-barrel domain